MGSDERVFGDRFMLLGRLGEGGNAVVWRARDRLMRTAVAIKILRSSDPDRQHRFAQEAEILANIRHPNVVRAFSRGPTTEGWPYVALELLSGRSLRARLDAGGPLPWREAVAIGIQVAEALDALHGRGVIHRDVKPGNIMLTSDDTEGPVVKLIDFGVAWLTEDWDNLADDRNTPPPRRLTDAGVAIGTPGYMPVEAGLGVPDERFDVYSLGATLYEMCTGKLPGIDPVRPLHEVESACDAPTDLAVVLAAALAPEPGDRTRTAGELGRALAAVLAAHPEHAASPLFDGRYERIAVMGTGATGEVFHANHRGSGHDVALKILRTTNTDEAQRFRREAHLLALFDHPCIPRFYDYAPGVEPPYIAMGRARGAPAASFCRLGGAERLSPVEVAQVGWQVAGALAYMHERGVLHRDVNANNVIIELPRTPRISSARVTPQRTPQVMLVDFGRAELTEKFYSFAAYRYLTPPESRAVIPDGGIHTLPWAAPEARNGHGFTDRSDVYSLGLLLFRLVTGKMPTSKGQSEPTSPRVYVPRCPEEIASAILSALNPDPRQRPDAAQLAARLEDALADDAPAGEEPDTRDSVSSPAGPALAVVAPPCSPKGPAPLDVSAKGGTPFMAAIPEHPGHGPAVPGRAPSAAPGDAAGSLPLHPRDIFTRATTLAPGFVPPGLASSGPPKRRAPIAAAVATLLLVAGGLVLWSVSGPATSIPTETRSPLLASQEPTVAPAAAPVEEPLPGPVTPEGTAEAMLGRASAALAACTTRASRPAFVEVSTSPGEPRFTTIDILSESDDGTACVRGILEQIRFQPATDADTFIKEYQP